jgi:hypothetical protein
VANAQVANTTANVQGKELLLADGAAQTVSKTITFDNGASPPFAAVAGSAMAPDLDAEFLQGEEPADFHDAAQLTGSIDVARLPVTIKPTVVALADGATPALNAALGTVFELEAAGNREIAVPTNPVDGQKIIIRHKASGADRTLTLNNGAGGFRFGSDITSLSATASGKWDYIGCIYNGDDSKWDVVAVAKGYS